MFSSEWNFPKSHGCNVSLLFTVTYRTYVIHFKYH